MSDVQPIPVAADTIQIGSNQIATADVQLIVAETGLSLSGGEMIIWKRNIVVTGSRRFVSRGDPSFNETNFKRWLGLCPHAVGILPNGTVQLPRLAADDPQDPLAVLESALAVAKKEMGSQLLKTLGFSLLLFVLGVAVIVLVVAYDVAHPQNPAFFRLGLFGLVLVVAACMMAVRFLMLFGRRSRILRALQEMTSKGKIRTDLLSQTLAPSPSFHTVGPPAVPTTPVSPAVAFVPTALATLSLLLMFCPFLGLVLALVTFAMTYSQKSWARTSAIVAIIVSVLSSTFALVMAIWG